MHIHLDARMYFHKHIKPGQRRHPEPRPADADRRHDQQLMGLAGRFARRVRGSASGARHRVSGCGVAERRHGITEEHLRAPRGVGVLEILVPRAPTTVRQASRCNAAPVTAQVGLLTCAGLPHRRAGAAVGGDHAHMRRPGTWGSSPKVVTRLAGTLDRIAARRRAQPATDTFSQICATGVGGADAHGDGLSLTQRLQRRGQRRPPGLLPGPSTVMVPPVPPVAAHQEPPSRRYRRSRWGGYDPGRSHPRPSPPGLAVTGRCCRRSQR